MSQNIIGVNNYTDLSGTRNKIKDFSVSNDIIFESEGIVSGLVVSQTSTPSPAVNISSGNFLIDCGENGRLAFKLVDVIEGLSVPNVGTAKYYLVCFKINLTNATHEFLVVEGTSGVDPNLTESTGENGTYYLPIARIEKTATTNVTDAEIVQDGTTLTNNSTPEIIYRRTDIAFNNADLQPKEWVVVDFESADGLNDQDYTLNGDNNDHLIIQEAVDYANTKGLGVYIRAQEEILLGDTVYLYDNSKLRGNGWDTILKAKNALNNSLIKTYDHGTTGNINIVVENLTLDGNRANQSSFTGGLLEIKKTSSGNSVDMNARITRVQVQNSYFKGIYLQNSNDNVIEFCSIHDCGSNGVDGFLSNNNKVKFNEVYDITEYVGILFNRRSQDNKILYNTVHDISDDGIQLRGYSAELPVQSIAWQSGNTVRITLESSVSTSSFSSLVAGDEINIRSATNSVNNGNFYVSAINTGSKYIDIINPSVSSSASNEATSPAVCSGNVELTTNNLIQGNTIYDVGIVIGGQGVLCNEYGCKANMIDNNTIKRSRVNGIEIAATAGEQTVTNNIIVDSGYQGGELVDALGEGHGISTSNDSYRNIIQCNRVSRSWRCGINTDTTSIIEANQVYDNGLKGSGSTYGIQHGDNCIVQANRVFETRNGANRTQTYGIVSGGDNSIIDNNYTTNNITAGYNVTGSNIKFWDDSTNTYTGKSGEMNFTSDVDARGYNVNGLKLQTVNSAGAIGGWLERESSDVQGIYTNRQTTNSNDVARFYVKANSGGAQTKVGAYTGDTNSKFYWQYLKALVAVETDLINEVTSGAGITIDGVLVKDGQLKNVIDPTSAQDAATKSYADSLVSALTAGNGLDRTANTFSVNVDNSTIEINSDSLRIKDAGVTDAKLASTFINVLYKYTGDTTVSNLATDTTVMTYTVPANTLGISNTIKVKINYDVLNNSGSNQVITFKASYGGTTFAQPGTPNFASSATPRPGVAEIILENTGGNTSVQYGSLWNSLATVTAAGQIGTAAIDSTTDQNLVFTVNLGAANANYSINIRAITIELIKG